MKREPRLVTMKEVTQNATRSWRRERTISIRCISLQAFSHSPGDEENKCRGRESERTQNLNKEAPVGKAASGGELGRGRKNKGKGKQRLNGGKEKGQEGEVLRPGYLAAWPSLG